ncbi:30S ribosomal protein S15, partial [Bienertia sinuspersici]
FKIKPSKEKPQISQAASLLSLMASLALNLKSQYKKPPKILLKTPTFSRFFSSSDNSNNNNNKNDDGSSKEKQYAFSGYFKDIKSKLKQHEEQLQQHSPGFRPLNLTTPDSSNFVKGDSISEIKKNLSEFRRRSTEIASSQQTNPNSFQNVHNQRLGNPSTVAQNKAGSLSFDSIRESLRKMNRTPAEQGDWWIPKNLPREVFGKEMMEKEKKKGEAGVGGDDSLNIELARLYTYDDLGEKLRELRPEIKGKKNSETNWFSLSELNERVRKLKEIEEQQLNDKIGGSAYGDLRMSLKILQDDKDKSKNTSMQVVNIRPQPRVLSSPKEHLVERYFHPDNMSSEEKLKLKLKAVRDEFKIHESDCGSTRVQIAQLTTEILHLSSVLHKKDKHSRRGLQAKVQQRKKLLKYLRRTDWESYSFVLSKLGLRDNPDYKN